jgi:hypothetical protein
VSVLDGTWSTPDVTCGQQNAALTNAGFSAAELKLGGWDRATCRAMDHGRRFQVRFIANRMIEFADGAVAWDGTYRMIDDAHFEAGDVPNVGLYIRYEFSLTGDLLVIDMTSNTMPAANEAELLGEKIAQTVIYETSPFVRDGTGTAFASTIYPYVLKVPDGWKAEAPSEDEDFFSGPAGVTMKVGTAIPEPGQTVADRVAANRRDGFAGCVTDPALDRPTIMGGEPGIIWSATCGDILNVASNTIHAGTGYRLLVAAPGGAGAMDVASGSLAGFLESFQFTE